MTANDAAQLADTILDQGGEDGARALIELTRSLAAENDDLRRESLATTVAQRAFASTTAFDASLAAFLAGGTPSAQQEP